MIIVPDSNIIISALINRSGREFKIITTVFSSGKFVIPSFLIEEVTSKITKITTFTLDSETDVANNFEVLKDCLLIIEGKDIPDAPVEQAIQLVSDIDVKDALFVALTIFYNGLLWTGDLKLLRGLRRKGFDQIITTKDLLQIINGL